MDRGGSRMFTGLIECIGKLVSITPADDVVRLKIEAPMIASELVLGQSVAVSGACVTVTSHDNRSFTVDIMPETQKRTKFRLLKTGSSVNLERALMAGGRFDGHIVSGHIDGTGAVAEIISMGTTRIMRIEAEKDIIDLIVVKGSVTLDGVSLTVIDVTQNWFSVGLIPVTLAGCTLGTVREGEIINIETDILGKYVLKFMNYLKDEKITTSSADITIERLREIGWS